ncbi:MAG TPA: protocatechuate 3,4-dioxygenase subunit alpha [Burkholderiales bacterium]
MNLVATASQTVGPYFHIGMDRHYVTDLAGHAADGKVVVRGRVLDGDAKPVSDALIELWQAGPDGKFGQPGFAGFGRVATDGDGAFRFVTLKPGGVPGPDGALQAPHIAVAVFMRGLLKQLVSRIYFPDETGNARDAVLALVPAERRATLIARKTEDGALEWNVILQGADETVFFDCWW